MFQIDMSPKTLNAEKLEKKFASLTKSRESILGLSTWIIRHKEFYKEIVDRWLDALSKDMNALTMFYVANDVIQNCGRKKAPEFREAFASVLERAVSLEKVKEIKAEVIRMLTLWHERSIYDATFYKKLQDKLNDVEASESEEELDETDIIANFKLGNLIDSLEKMKTLEEELLVKEEFLEDIEEPGITNIDNLIVKMDSQKELRKVDKFQKLVESYLSLADRVMTAQKEAMLNLKYSSIFYTAQLEDAKKVAHAYRIYGKKVKIVEKALVEKLASLPEASPVLEEKSPDIELNSNPEYQSPDLSVTSDLNNENSNQSSNLDLSTTPKMNESDSFMDTNIFNEKYKSPLTDSQNSLTNLSKGLSSDNKVIQTPAVASALNEKVEKEEESPKAVESATISLDEKMLKSPLMNTASKMSDKVSTIISKDEKMLKSPLMNTVSKKSDKILKSPTFVDATNNQIVIDTPKSLNSEKILKSPIVVEKVRRTSTDQKSRSPAVTEAVKRTSTDKKSRSPSVTETVKRTSADQKSKSSAVTEGVRRTSADQKSKSPAATEAGRKTSVDKTPKCSASAVLENTLSKDTKVDISESLSSGLDEKKSKKPAVDKESSAKKILSVEKNEEISSTSKEPGKSESDLQTLSDIENIDFLLEKSYNEQRTKSKASFKRKIDNLLKMKQSKSCKLSSDDDLQKNKAVSDTYVAEDSTSVSCSNSNNGKKSNISEPLIIKEENVVLDSGNSKDKDKTVVVSNSEPQIDDSKVDQSLEEMTQKSKATDSGTTSETVALPASVPFPNFPDIPTELLKNILDKHRTNLNQSSSINSCSTTSELSNLKTENVEPSDSYQDNINCNNNINDKKDIPSGLSSTLDSEVIDITSDIQENSMKDNENSVNINKGDSKMDTENVTKNNSTSKMTPLMENLQKLLKCFTEKGPAFEELKKSKTLNTLPTYSLKSTLKLYHVLNEHHKNDNAFSSSGVNNNSLPNFPSETASSGNNKSSVCNYNSTNAFVHSKNDNLEIMDMEVDSDDESAK